jgi:hypothetical protein
MMSKFFNPRMFLAWILSTLAAFAALGFLSNFYSSFLEVLLLTLLLQTIGGLLIYRLLGKAKALLPSQPVDLAIGVALFLALTAFVLGMFGMVKQFPRLFDAQYFLLKNDQLLPFFVGSLLVIPSLAHSRKFVKQGAFKQSASFLFMNEVVTGLLVAGFFFIVYLMLASIFNQPVFDVDDIFFDSDGLLWRTRFVTGDYRDYYWRAVHPFVLLIVRPLIALVSFFLKGDRLAAAFVLVAFTGALCVFLAWYFVKHTSGNPLYAVLIASLLGASAAHLVFGSLIETYIFLATVALIFMVLLLKDKPLFALIFAGALSFGITITNFIQTAIAFIFVKRDFKQWVKYGLIVGALIIPLTLLNNFVYPNSQPYFFIPSSFTAEADNTFAPSVARGTAILRVMFLHSVVAPDPLILEEEIPFLKVWIFKADPMRLSEYETVFGTGLALFWVALFLLGGFLFLKGLRKADNRFSFAFILILLFNFTLHLRYGKDLFLYSTNWTYAIILFFSLSWREVAEKKWFQVVLLAFLALLLVNNSRLILVMLQTSALHIK